MSEDIELCPDTDLSLDYGLAPGRAALVLSARVLKDRIAPKLDVEIPTCILLLHLHHPIIHQRLIDKIQNEALNHLLPLIAAMVTASPLEDENIPQLQPRSVPPRTSTSSAPQPTFTPDVVKIEPIDTSIKGPLPGSESGTLPQRLRPHF